MSGPTADNRLSEGDTRTRTCAFAMERWPTAGLGPAVVPRAEKCLHSGSIIDPAQPGGKRRGCRVVPRAPDRFATPAETRLLVDAVPAVDRAARALAFYAGLRLGEIRALDWSSIDLDAGELHVDRAYCNRTRQVTAPKTAAAVRTVPIVGELRRVLLEHRLLTGRRDGLVIQRAGSGVESGDKPRVAR